MIGVEVNTYCVSALCCAYVVPEVSASLLQLQDCAVPYESVSLHSE